MGLFAALLAEGAQGAFTRRVLQVTRQGNVVPCSILLNSAIAIDSDGTFDIQNPMKDTAVALMVRAPGLELVACFARQEVQALNTRTPRQDTRSQHHLCWFHACCRSEACLACPVQTCAKLCSHVADRQKTPRRQLLSARGSCKATLHNTECKQHVESCVSTTDSLLPVHPGSAASRSARCFTFSHNM